ncbi:hypothetical protein B0H34DRAFT_860000 [Crassisporium funariophilum]|nr:hypothetical protein B0H34DRAFT_860000 [Crassisporium funariophilum]
MDLHRSTGPQQPWINTTIPTDVLCEIMVQTKLISEVDTTHETQTKSPIFYEKSKLDMTPLRLSHVCAYWHTMAKGLSSLWNSISIMDTAATSPELLTLWLDRGMGQPIFIYLCQVNPIDSTRDNLRRALTILGPHVHRWKSLSIHLDLQLRRRNLVPPFLDILRALLQHSQLTLLQSLDVKVSIPMCVSDSIAVKLYQLLCPASPTLDTIKLGLYGGSFLQFLSLPLLPIPWGQLKHLYINTYFLDPSEFLDTLSKCPFLETLSCLNCCVFREDGPGQPYPAVLLDRLRVFIFTCAYDPVIFDSLILPSLREFRFNANPELTPETRSAERVEAMLARSACHLDDFTFDRWSEQSEELPSHFLSLPASASLQSLMITSGVTAPLVKELTVSRNSGPEREWESHAQSKGAVLLPDLTSLVIVGCPVEDGLLLEMARSRVSNSSCAHLKSLRVQASWEHESSHARDLDGFQKLREEGLEFSLTFSSKPSLSS